MTMLLLLMDLFSGRGRHDRLRLMRRSRRGRLSMRRSRLALAVVVFSSASRASFTSSGARTVLRTTCGRLLRRGHALLLALCLPLHGLLVFVHYRRNRKHTRVSNSFKQREPIGTVGRHEDEGRTNQEQEKSSESLPTASNSNNTTKLPSECHGKDHKEGNERYN